MQGTPWLQGTPVLGPGTGHVTQGGGKGKPVLTDTGLQTGSDTPALSALTDMNSAQVSWPQPRLRVSIYAIIWWLHVGLTKLKEPLFAEQLIFAPFGKNSGPSPKSTISYLLAPVSKPSCRGLMHTRAHQARAVEARAARPPHTRGKERPLTSSSPAGARGARGYTHAASAWGTAGPPIRADRPLAETWERTHQWVPLTLQTPRRAPGPSDHRRSETTYSVTSIVLPLLILPVTGLVFPKPPWKIHSFLGISYRELSENTVLRVKTLSVNKSEPENCGERRGGNHGEGQRVQRRLRTARINRPRLNMERRRAERSCGRSLGPIANEGNTSQAGASGSRPTPGDLERSTVGASVTCEPRVRVSRDCAHWHRECHYWPASCPSLTAVLRAAQYIIIPPSSRSVQISTVRAPTSAAAMAVLIVLFRQAVNEIFLMPNKGTSRCSPPSNCPSSEFFLLHSLHFKWYFCKCKVIFCLKW